MQHVMHLKSLRATSFCFGMVASNIGEASQEGSLVKLRFFRERTQTDSPAIFSTTQPSQSKRSSTIFSMKNFATIYPLNYYHQSLSTILYK